MGLLSISGALMGDEVEYIEPHVITPSNEIEYVVWLREPEFLTDGMGTFRVDFPTNWTGRAFKSLELLLPARQGSEGVVALVPVAVRRGVSTLSAEFSLIKSFAESAELVLRYGSDVGPITELHLRLAAYVTHQPYQQALSQLRKLAGGGKTESALEVLRLIHSVDRSDWQEAHLALQTLLKERTEAEASTVGDIVRRIRRMCGVSGSLGSTLKITNSDDHETADP